MKHFIKYTIILLAGLTSIFGFAQNHPPVIDLPTNGGTMIGEIIHANGKIFAYGADGISVFDDDNDYDLLAKISFGTTSEFGKFNPVYYDATFASPDQSLMVYNDNTVEGERYLYAITPDLKLLVIDTDNLSDYWLLDLPVSENEMLDQALDSQSGVVILRYDKKDDPNKDDRLYMMVAARNRNINGTGNFHKQKTIFGIYTVKPNVAPGDEEEDHITRYYSEINAPVDEGDDIYGDQVVNFIFNERDDFFYLLRLGESTPDSKAIIEVREIGSDFVYTIEFENTNGTGYYKMAKMLYIDNNDGNGNDVHKILVFPYKFFIGSTVPKPRFYVIDGNNYTNVKYVEYAEEKILDALYLEGNKDLILSFAPETNGASPDDNLAVFRYNPNAGEEDEPFDLIQEFSNDNSTVTSDFDLNVSLHLTKLNGTTAFISKKDGISKIEYNSDNGLYNYIPMLDLESNFIRKGALTSDKIFFNNTLANGMEVYNINSGQFETENIRTGYPVYDVTANADGSNMYFYNKLNAHNIGFYSHQLPTNPEEEATTTHINIETAIGDIIYNPWQDQFLVSKFEPGNAEIQIYNASDNTEQGVIPLAEAEFAKEIFLAPNGNLYVCANMNNSGSHNPKIFIIDASDYSIINSYDEVGGFVFKDGDGNDKPFAYYKASFEYNADNESVYISMAIQDLQKLPYNSQASSLFNIIDPTNPVDPPPGKIIVLNDNSTKVNLSHFPGKVICPGSDNSSSQFENKLFIAGEQFYEYDYGNAPLPGNEDGFIIHEDHYFLDMVYSPYHDRIFAIREDKIGGISSEHRTFEIWTIDYNETVEINQVDFNEQPDGQIASIFYNPYDKRIYVYQKIDGAKLGDEEVKLLSFDPESENPVWAATNLGFASYFPEYDHTRDDAQFWYYNMTTPYINPSTNLIYLPNGGHSCVSKVPFVAKEPLALRPAKKDDNGNYISLTWLSFPRLDRTIGDNIPVNLVLGGDNIVPDDYQDESEIRNLPLTGGGLKYNRYNEVLDVWQPVGDLGNIYSTLGYKLYLNYGQNPPSNNWVLLSGTVLDPNETVIVNPEHENWEGYWLYQSQSPFDAIPDDVLDQLTYMEAQNWACMKRTGSYKDNQQPTWICSVHTGIGQIGKVSLDYGDMVILESAASEQISFQWLSTSNPPEEKIKPDVDYYQFTELADYTSFFIELDSTENPQEIAAFIGDSCVGATTVLPDDTTVLVPGYIEGMEGDVTFEEYYGSEKTAKQPIRSYLVNDLNTGNWEQRTIRSGERKGHYLISFGKQAENTYPDNAATAFRIWPNPASDNLFYSFLLEDDAYVNISIFDISGKRVANPVDEPMPAGSLTGELSLTGFSGGQLKPGVYLVKAKLGDSLFIRKVIVN